MVNNDVIIIGAGAAGLMAAMQLSRGGRKVLVLEARDRIGGRIYTLYDEQKGFPLEIGAEFIHGDLPVTLSLLQEAGIAYTASGGEMWRAQDGVLTHEYHFIKGWHLFEEQLEALEEDMSINSFLDKHFSGDSFEELRTSVRRYAEGYDNADPNRASALALRREWLEEETAEQHKVDKGYSTVIHFMADIIQKNGGNIITNATVKEIQWQEGAVTITTSYGHTYTASKCIITAPLGILQADKTAQCSIGFSPAIPNHTAALKDMGMGTVIKILLVFKERFWKNEAIVTRAKGSMEKMLFIFSEAPVPTWWTQYPDESPLLTGWLGGHKAEELRNSSDEEVLQIAIDSLASIFQLSGEEIKGLLLKSIVANWGADKYTLGSYTYATVETAQALELLMQPVKDTLYFAGEAFYTGSEMGTVEAALASGKSVAERILNG